MLFTTLKTQIKNTVLIATLASLLACGGGGGSGPAPVAGTDGLTLSTNQLNFNADITGVRPAQQNITGTVTGVNVDVRVDIIISGTAITRAVYLPIDASTGQLTVVPNLPATLGVGTHIGNVKVYVCPDQGVTCVGNNSQIAGSPKTVNITYTVTGANNTAVNVNGKVYDAELPGAEVTFYYSGNPNVALATSITDNTGNYTVNLTVAAADRNKSIIAIARRGSVVLRSIIGNAGSVADATAAAGGSLSSINYPGAIVSNVTTAMLAVIRKETGSIPATQAEIDAAIALIKADPVLIQKVIDIAAIIKAVVDYGVPTTAFGTNKTNDTNTLAILLANGQVNITTSLNTAAKLALLPDAAALVAKVTQDPVTAAQIPTDTAALAAAVVNGNSYAVLDPDATGSILVFDGAGKYTTYTNDSMDAPILGSYSVSGSIITAIQQTAPVIANQTIKATILTGNINSFQVSVTIDGVNDGTRNLRRIIPVSAAANSPTNIQTASLQNKIFVDISNSQSAVIPTLCNGSMLSGGALITAKAAVVDVACKEHASGMLKLTSPDPALVNTVYLGFFADSWDGTTVSQAINAALFNNTEATFNRAYQPLDVDPATGGPVNNRIVLRVHQNKKVTLRIATTGTGTVVDPVIGDYYRNNSRSTVNAFSQNIYVAQAVTAFGALKLNYSTLLNSTRLRYSIKLGKQSGTRLNAVFRSNDDTNAIPASLNNPPGSVNTRVLYKLEPLTEADILAGGTVAQFRFTNLIDSTKYNTVNFSKINNVSQGKITKANGTVIQTTWAITAVPSAVPNSTASGNYQATLTITETATGNKRYYYVDKTFGTNSFVLGSFRVDAAGTYSKVRGFIATRR